MIMKRWVGILSGLLAAAACALGFWILLVVIGWPVGEARLAEWLTGARRMPNALLLIAAALAIGAVGVLVLYGLFSARFAKRTSATIERSALGETSVSFAALEALSNRTAKANGDVRSCRTKVSAIGDDIRIEVRVVTAPTVSLLEITHSLQDAIAACIREVCGVAVGRIDVTVDQTDEPAADKHVK